MSQLTQPFPQGEPISRRALSNISLSPTTENQKVTIALKGAGPSLSFQDDLAVGRNFREARFETSIFESVFSNVEVSSGTLNLGSTARSEPLLRRSAGIFALLAGQGSSAPQRDASVVTIDVRSPATEHFRINEYATVGTTAEQFFAVEEASLRAIEAAEQECEEDLRDELLRERALWKYGRR